MASRSRSNSDDALRGSTTDGGGVETRDFEALNEDLSEKEEGRFGREAGRVTVNGEASGFKGVGPWIIAAAERGDIAAATGGTDAEGEEEENV